MQLATKQKPDVKADLRALVNGQYVGDADALIEKVAADVLLTVLERVKAKSGAEAVAGLANRAARKEVASRLAEWLIRDNERVDAGSVCLPVAKWSPEKVIERTGVSKSTLYRSGQTQFYCVVPIGKKNGRAYPAWQFVGDVPSHLPEILSILRGDSRIQVNTFFMSEQDALNELSPAEVLAGMPFEDRKQVAPEQKRMLSLPLKQRLIKIGALARMEVAGLE
ncbi:MULTISPECIES: hypothetical protein [unclassified Paraburkholderia]|uniref:hypothetical protein n=1 Tax=unclassified Paraburkholderia TaxID=2615204 RepID=UPI002AB25461|nr:MULTISPECIES: hypothetical protein [unclassified Paraburkholderia]